MTLQYVFDKKVEVDAGAVTVLVPAVGERWPDGAIRSGKALSFTPAAEIEWRTVAPGEVEGEGWALEDTGDVLAAGQEYYFGPGGLPVPQNAILARPTGAEDTTVHVRGA